MTQPVRLTIRAQAFVRREVACLRERSPQAAARLATQLERAFALLEAYPQAGPRGPVPGTRRLAMGDYVLTYVVGKRTIEVVAIRHGRQNDAL